MIYFVISDGGVDTQPIKATSFQDAVNQVKARYAGGPAPVNIAVLSPLFTGTANPDGTITQTGDASTQNTIFQAASNALTNNQTYLGITNPTNAQVVSQVQALTRQMDGVIRLLVGNFSATT